MRSVVHIMGSMGIPESKAQRYQYGLKCSLSTKCSSKQEIQISKQVPCTYKHWRAKEHLPEVVTFLAYWEDGLSNRFNSIYRSDGADH